VATSRFVKLPDAGWWNSTTRAVQAAHEAMADLGVDELSNLPQKIGWNRRPIWTMPA
jgi:hypothetical protein